MEESGCASTGLNRRSQPGCRGVSTLRDEPIAQRSRAKAAVELTPAEQQVYIEAARRRAQAEKEALARRHERAWALAREVANLLKRKYGASRVVAFGSLVDRGRFTRWSDVDIAAWGLSVDVFYPAVAEVAEIDPEIPVDLIDMNDCPQSLRDSIEREGVDL